jgi:pyrroline-5-carboxylate reductase
MKTTLEFLDGAAVGVFGAGHLGRAVALALLKAKLPLEQLVLCHSGSAATRAAVAALGLADRVVTPARLLDEAKIVLYLVRPQAADAIAGLPMRPGALLVSFLAGTGLARIPAAVPQAARVRVMVSDPDTLAKENGIAAMFPENATVQAMLQALGLSVLVLPSEDRFHAFTAMGPCLPMAAAWCLGHDQPIDHDGLLALGERYGFSDYPEMIAWALEICPKGLAREDLNEYLRHAATPGGVTEAVINGLRDGDDIAAALERGIRRCEDLAKG